MCVAEKRQIACLKNEAEDTEAQQLKKFEDEARQQKKIEDEAQREFQRKRNSKLMRQMQEVSEESSGLKKLEGRSPTHIFQR